jgi:hypothetical protein
LSVRAIELPENAELSHFEKRLAAGHIDEDALEDFIHVVRLTGKVLVIPVDLSCIGTRASVEFV